MRKIQFRALSRVRSGVWMTGGIYQDREGTYIVRDCGSTFTCPMYEEVDPSSVHQVTGCTFQERDVWEGDVYVIPESKYKWEVVWDEESDAFRFLLHSPDGTQTYLPDPIRRVFATHPDFKHSYNSFHLKTPVNSDRFIIRGSDIYGLVKQFKKTKNESNTLHESR